MSTAENGRDLGRAYLAARLRAVEQTVRSAVEVRRASDPAPDDPFRGLYLTDEAVSWLLTRDPRLPSDEQDEPLLSEARAIATQASAVGADVPLLRLAATFGLVEADVELLVTALLPEVDATYEHLFGYLNDDVTRRRPTVGLAIQLCGLPVSSGGARSRLAQFSPLLTGGLIIIEESERSFLGRELRVPDRVVAHLLGDDRLPPSLTEMLAENPPVLESDVVGPLAEALKSGTDVVYLRESLGGPGRSVAAKALAAAGLRILPVNLEGLVESPERRQLVGDLVREARLMGAGIVAVVPSMLGKEGAEILRRLTQGRAPVVIIGQATWDPSWSLSPPLVVDAPEFMPTDRDALWRSLLGDPSEAVVTAASPFLLSPDGVAKAAQSAQREARYQGSDVGIEHLRRGARQQNAAGLERLARRIEPSVGWDDLVLTPMLLGQLKEIALRARHRERVLGEWRMRPGGGRGRGVTALFAGDSGTGKTMSAEVIAGDLGLDLFTVDLATVVDKYVGETEKNLERIFAEAAGVNGVLLFDEADAVFGKRSEVKDAHDRYANIESAYLLQRMESFDGLAILATNLRANLDDAFTRRLDMILDFPNPDVDQRRLLWHKCLGEAIPRDDDLDLDFCAQSFDVTGGSIRASAVTAAYLAADSDGQMTMEHLIGAIEREYRKLGRLLLPAEFGDYLGSAR